ncbi:MAG TPA: zinc-ribbon domain containing protein [Planctomycetota bacterium]|nr:zinc-ribbon domain containing protein [Planctomycetota bacterium]
MKEELNKAGVGLRDKTLTCCDCNASFVFTVRDQEFFAAKNYSEPRRCKPCREIKKAKRDNV